VGRWVGASVGNSLALGAWGASLTVGAGLVLGHALARGWAAAPFVQSVALLGFVTPAAVLGTGLIAVWNRPATQAVYASSAILVLGVVARYGVLPLALLEGAIAQGARTLEDAAAVSGAGFARRLVAIVAPLHRRALLGAWLLAFVFCVRDLETSILFYPPGGEPLTVRLFTLEANGPAPVVAALALLQVGLTALVLLVASALLLRRRRP
jgi:iron(III) transport system permease protein